MKDLFFFALFVILVGNTAVLSSPSTDDSAQLPIPTRTVRPPYPALARAQKISGTVLVDVRVNSGGTVAETTALTGPDILRNPARAAAWAWRFKPFVPDIGTYVVRLTFIFHDKAYVAPTKAPDFTTRWRFFIRRLIPSKMTTQHYKSLDASGGSVFRKIIGPATLE